MAKYVKVSTGDSQFTHPYLIPSRYIEIATERLQSGLLGPMYRKLLHKQIKDCYKEMEKRAK